MFVVQTFKSVHMQGQELVYQFHPNSNCLGLTAFQKCFKRRRANIIYIYTVGRTALATPGLSDTISEEKKHILLEGFL